MAIRSIGEIQKGKTLILTTSITAGVSSITISNIPQFYSDLIILWRNLTQSSYASGASYSQVRFNSDTTAGNYIWHTVAPSATTTTLSANSVSGSTFWADGGTALNSPFQGYTSDYPYSWGYITINSYTSNLDKLLETRTHAAGVNRSSLAIGTFRGSAITSINVTPNAAFTYTSGTILLYGIV